MGRFRYHGNQLFPTYREWKARMNMLMSELRHRQDRPEFCHDPRHVTPCQLPCKACAEECCDTAAQVRARARGKAFVLLYSSAKQLVDSHPGQFPYLEYDVKEIEKLKLAPPVNRGK